MVKETMTIAHFSDLHVGSHSWGIWESLTRRLLDVNPDLFVISGDISECNEEHALQFVLNWMKDAISEDDTSQAFGLRLGESFFERVIIIPGNHDYYNLNKNNRIPVQLPKGDKEVNFYKVFRKHELPRWHFVENIDGSSIYIIAVESPAEMTIANGYVSKEDLELIRKWTDQGRHGNLKRNGHLLGIAGLKEEEATNRFNQSFKILVLHHYLHLPRACGEQPMMSVQNAHEVWGQIASDDFDMILSGHEHHDFFGSLKYQEVLDHRATRRFSRMYCIRQLGLRHPPVYHIDENNKLLPKYVRIAINYFKSKADKIDDVYGTTIYRWRGISLAERSIRKGFKEFLKVDLKDNMIKNVISKISEIVLPEIRSVLKRRHFINSIAATATRANEPENGFYVYKIGKNRKVECSPYCYSYEKNEFMIDTDRVESFSLSRPLDLFKTKVYNKLKEANIFK